MQRGLVSGGALVVLAAGHLSCAGGSGGSPTTPALTTLRSNGWPAGTVVTVVSGETEAPVAGARVGVAGASQATDDAGQTVVQACTEGTAVDVEAPGFLARQTLARSAVTRLTLWPEHAKLPREYTKTLVYTASMTADSTSVVPLERLPPRVRAVALAPSRALAADPLSMAAHRRAADYFNVAVDGRTVVLVGGAADMTVPTRIDADDASCEAKPGRLLARTWVSGYEVTRAEIIFCGERPSRLPTPIAHELGHVFGLAHSPDRRDVMYAYYNSRNQRGFSERETLTMSLIHLRRAGNVWPDNDRAAAPRGIWRREFVD